MQPVAACQALFTATPQPPLPTPPAHRQGTQNHDLHTKAGPAAQVGYLEAVDAMVGQLIRRLAQAEDSRAGQSGSGPGSVPAGQSRPCTHRQYALCITGDHSTPAVFGDHSHEPVPFTLAHVRWEQLSTMKLSSGWWMSSALSLCW